MTDQSVILSSMDKAIKRQAPRGPSEAAAGSRGPAGPNRAERAAERRAAIVEAAMEEFVARGFAATRLDDIARRAGVAKGTIYLHFKDKESMFEELIGTAIVPLVGPLQAPPPPNASIRGAWSRPAGRTSAQIPPARRGSSRKARASPP